MWSLTGEEEEEVVDATEREIERVMEQQQEAGCLEAGCMQAGGWLACEGLPPNDKLIMSQSPCLWRTVSSSSRPSWPSVASSDGALDMSLLPGGRKWTFLDVGRHPGHMAVPLGTSGASYW